jgi:hypothetical protein
MVRYTEPRIVTRIHNERFATEEEAAWCADWLDDQSNGDCVLYVFERDGEWLVAW